MTDTPPRPDGFYWIRQAPDVDPEVAHHLAGGWMLAGSDDHDLLAAVEVLGGPLAPPRQAIEPETAESIAALAKTHVTDVVRGLCGRCGARDAFVYDGRCLKCVRTSLYAIELAQGFGDLGLPGFTIRSTLKP